MTKYQIIDVIANQTGIPKKTVKTVLETQARIAADTLKDKDNFHLVGLGNLKAITTKAREGRNPTTGEKINIPSRCRLSSKSGKSLKDAIN